MKKTILALILVVLMVMPLLVSCGDDKKPGNNSSSTETTTGSNVDPEVAEIDEYVSDLASNANFSGSTFAYIGKGVTLNVPEVEEESGNLLSDAVYYRQREIEELFGVDWENVKTEDGEDTQNKVIMDYMASMGAYDLVHGAMHTVGQPLMFNGAITDINELSTIDLSRDWWVSSLNDTYAINGELYFLTGPIVVENFYDAACVMFNKDVADNYDIPDLYEIVESGEWTIDKMVEIANMIPANSTGDGTYRYGMYNHRDVGLDIMFASGMQLTYFDENGTPYIANTLSTELSDFADKMSKIFGDDSITCIARVKGNSAEEASTKYGVTELNEMFINGNVLFWFESTEAVMSLREKEVEFGILPTPKGDASMEYTTFSANGTAVYIPKMAKDIEKVDVITEAMGALSQKHVQPAFYDKVLKGRSTYDSESRGMIDIIFSTKVYDLIDLYGGGDMNSKGAYINLINRAIVNDSSTLASGYRGTARSTSAMLTNLLRSLAREDK